MDKVQENSKLLHRAKASAADSAQEVGIPVILIIPRALIKTDTD